MRGWTQVFLTYIVGRVYWNGWHVPGVILFLTGDYHGELSGHNSQHIIRVPAMGQIRSSIFPITLLWAAKRVGSLLVYLLVSSKLFPSHFAMWVSNLT